MPALLTSTSSPPSLALTAWNNAATLASSATSATTVCSPGSSLPASARRAWLTSQIITAAPAR